MKLELNEEKHLYFLDNRPIPGVNQLLKEGGIIDDTFFTEEGKIRGRAVHKAAYLMIHNRLDFEKLHPKIQGHVFAVKDFLKRSGFKPILHLCEKPQFHPRFLYAGTPDLVGPLNNQLSIIDIKTGSAGLAADMQNAAYDEIFREMQIRIDARFRLETTEGGTYRLKQCEENPELISAFLSIVNLHHFKIKRGILCKQ